MKLRGGTWAAYENQALDSADLGRLQYLKFGPGCTYETPPAQYPDTAQLIGWKYRYVGTVDLETGNVIEKMTEGERVAWVEGMNARLHKGEVR